MPRDASAGQPSPAAAQPSPTEASAAQPSPTELLDLAQSCSCLAARRIARAMTRAYDEALAPSGVRITELTMLVAGGVAPDAPLSRLAEVLSLDRTTLTRDLKRLEDRGLLHVVPGEDRRSRVVRLTEEGRDVLAEAFPRWRAAQDRLGATAGVTWRDVAVKVAEATA
jgi:DNA-binding MarR family transcriptional regulator